MTKKKETNGRRHRFQILSLSLLTFTSWLVLLPNSSSVLLRSSTSCDSRAASTRRPLCVVARTLVRGAENAGEPLETPSPPPPLLPPFVASSLGFFPPNAFFFFLPPADPKRPLGAFFAIVESNETERETKKETTKKGNSNQFCVV